MLKGAKAQLDQAKDYVTDMSDKADQAVDAKIDELQAKIDELQAKMEQAKESRFTWLIAAGIAAALLSLAGLVVLS